LVENIPAIVMNEAGPFNPNNNIPPIAVTDTIDYSNRSGGLNIFVTENDIDPDSDDLRLAQIVNEPAGIGFIKENKIIYAPPTNATGIDTLIYSVVDTEGGIDTGYVLIFMDGITNVENELGDSEIVKIFPNPADDSVVVELLFENPKEVEIQIVNQAGQNMNSFFQNQGSKLILTTKEFPSGNYVVVIKNEDRIYTKKIVVAH
ncbi:MAG: T9SS type A sorting domain-containing protein, partial [Bacteroidota bacterium]